ncbi:uncharacterized protein KIAA1958-like [Clytia hemisphaerica]|uniref:uncharacterized protein KIAA1958-like n=1 Tax=Clytia hemisphaerica TaxID=252671 RepID=UPI0034D51D6D
MAASTSSSRFNLLSNEDLESLSTAAENKNTNKSTNNGIRVYKQRANVRKTCQNLEDFVDAKSLDGTLAQFYAELTKQNGDGYEPDSLRVMQSSLHRYLVEKGSTMNILKDQSFSKSRKILEGKARILRGAGKGKKRNASSALDPDEEELLWSVGKLGDNSAISLVRTMWFVCSEHFGLRGCQEHCTMRVEDFIFKKDKNGCDFVEFIEDPTKTRQSGLKPIQRKTNPKMYAIGGERCPVRLLRLYLSKRPESIQESGRFYLTPKKSFNPNDDVWFMQVPMGKTQSQES